MKQASIEEAGAQDGMQAGRTAQPCQGSAFRGNILQVRTTFVRNACLQGMRKPDEAV